MNSITPIEPGDAIIPGNPPMVRRYPPFIRVTHWVAAVAMVLLALSGLAMFHPSLFFLSVLFGGGQNTRALHPWLGLVWVVSFAVLFVRFFRTNFWTLADLNWSLHLGDLLTGHEDKMPEMGKYNAGQKFVFWVMALLMLALLGSGVVIWSEYFSGMTPITSQRLAILAHSVAAIFAISVLILHAYSAIWVRGSFDAMIRGKVPVGWVYHHHRKWLRALIGKAQIGPAE